MTKKPIPVLPTVHYNMGGIPTNYMGEALTLRDGNPDTVIPGLMSIGEAACVSVHGANRLGSNSLIDLVVFGKAAGVKCAEAVKPGEKHAELAKSAGDEAIARLDKFRNAKGGTPTAQLRNAMQKAMQNDAAVFRTGETLEQGRQSIHAIYDGVRDIAISDRSMIWNSRSRRDAGIRQPDRTSDRHHRRRGEPAREPRRACAGRFPQPRRPELDEAHAGMARSADGQGAPRLSSGAHLHAVQRRRIYPAKSKDLLRTEVFRTSGSCFHATSIYVVNEDLAWALMTLEPLLAAPLAIKIHVATVVPAFLIGTYLIFLSRKGAPFHRALGYAYLTLITVTSIAALFVHALMPNSPVFGMSPVHLLVPLTLFGVVGALRGAWTHNIAMHRRAMLGVYIGGMLIAGSLTLLPGRIMHAVFFGG